MAKNRKRKKGRTSVIRWPYLNKCTYCTNILVQECTIHQLYLYLFKYIITSSNKTNGGKKEYEISK